MIQGIIFDLNGTMIFDKSFHDRAWQMFLENQIHREITDAEFHEHVYGCSAQDILSYFLQRNISPAESLLIEEEKEKIYRILCLQSSDFHLAEGLPAFLNELKARKIPITIATASARNNMQFFFSHLHLSEWFQPDKIIYNTGTFPGKPAPDIFLKAAQLLHVPIKQCAVFEDAKSGIQAAVTAGAGHIVGVSSMLDKETLLSLGANQVIANYTGFYQLLSERNFHETI